MQGLAVCGADCYCEASTVCMYLLLLSSLGLMCLLTTDSRALLHPSALHLPVFCAWCMLVANTAW